MRQGNDQGGGAVLPAGEGQERGGICGSSELQDLPEWPPGLISYSSCPGNAWDSRVLGRFCRLLIGLTTLEGSVAVLTSMSGLQAPAVSSHLHLRFVGRRRGPPSLASLFLLHPPRLRNDLVRCHNQAQLPESTEFGVSKPHTRAHAEGAWSGHSTAHRACRETASRWVGSLYLCSVVGRTE